VNESFSIRLARRDEVELLGMIERTAGELFAGTDVAADLNGSIFDPDELAELIELGQVWVACFDDDLPVGFVIVLEYGDVLHIEELDVLPEFGRRGIGTALLEHVCSWAASNGFSAATLSTFREVRWNAPFYVKHGFRVLDPHELTPWMNTMRETEARSGLKLETRVVMRRELS
jgi:4-diphosphocytidyl-2-C-methyl-D-erythritol kinase